MPAESALARALGADDGGWTLDSYLLAHIADGIWAGVWQRGSGKGKRPKPIPRPGLEPDKDTQGLGTVRTLEDIDEMRRNTRRG